MALAALSLLAGAGVLPPGLSVAAAAEVESRDFSILVDGKKSGAYHWTLSLHEDGTATLAAQSDVRVTLVGVPVYTYSYRGQEVWKGGRLQRFQSSGKENSRTFAVSARAEGEVLRVTADGKEAAVRPDVWTTSCWRLPDPAFRNGPVPLLGCDNGQSLNGQVQFLGGEKVDVAGREQVCAHYRVMKNNVPHDLWYDGQERMVREEWVSGGHRTVLEVTRIRH
jgi:hypothetical protein